jgi:hypothetical protein
MDTTDKRFVIHGLALILCGLVIGAIGYFYFIYEVFPAREAEAERLSADIQVEIEHDSQIALPVNLKFKVTKAWDYEEVIFEDYVLQGKLHSVSCRKNGWQSIETESKSSDWQTWQLRFKIARSAYRKKVERLQATGTGF